jgi:hypothetical protein
MAFATSVSMAADLVGIKLAARRRGQRRRLI